MIRKQARTLAITMAAVFGLTTLAVGSATAQQAQQQTAQVVQVSQQDNTTSGPRLEQRQPTVSGANAFKSNSSNAYRHDTVVITATTLGLIALIVLLLLVL